MAIKHCFTLFLLLFLACDNDNKGSSLPTKYIDLVGEWLLKETYISPGGITDWKNVDKGFRYIFGNQGTFQKTAFDKVIQQEGNYQVKEDELFLIFKVQEEQDTLGYRIELMDNSLTLSPSYPSICIEGCLYRFKRQ